MTAPTITVKRCTKCGETKSVDRFSRNRSHRDGLESQCKDCCRDYIRAYREAHREEIRAKERAYREAHREEIRARKRAYHEAHREEKRTYNLAYAEAHREEIRAYREAYRDAHLEERRAYDRERHALLGNQTKERWREITAKHATRRGRWSEAEDAYLAASTDRVVDDALALKRTHWSVQHRIDRLRKRGVTLARDAHRR